MNRLTIRNSDGSVSQPTDLKWAEALERLAQYEDTGLTPREVEAQKCYRIDGMPLERFVEIITAELDGRLVVLPCKVGNTVFVLTERGIIAKGKVCNFRFFDKLIVDVEYHHFGTCATSRYWGETVFLTREAAEAALKGEKEGV